VDVTRALRTVSTAKVTAHSSPPSLLSTVNTTKAVKLPNPVTAKSVSCTYKSVPLLLPRPAKTTTSPPLNPHVAPASLTTAASTARRAVSAPRSRTNSSSIVGAAHQTVRHARTAHLLRVPLALFVSVAANVCSIECLSSGPK